MPSPTKAQLRERLKSARSGEDLAWKQADFWQADAVKKTERLAAAAAACAHVLYLHGKDSCTCETCIGARYALGMPSLVEQGALALGGVG